MVGPKLMPRNSKQWCSPTSLLLIFRNLCILQRPLLLSPLPFFKNANFPCSIFSSFWKPFSKNSNSSSLKTRFNFKNQTYKQLVFRVVVEALEAKRLVIYNTLLD